MWDEPLPLVEVTLPTLAENLALDEALLLHAEDDPRGCCLRLWEVSEFAVILGRSNSVAAEVRIENCRRDDVPILRRCSGGGAVVIGPGCLCFSLVLPIAPEQHLHDIPAVTAAILKRIVAAFSPHLPNVVACGTSDLAIGNRKVSGNSQRWLRRSMLHHGTLLYGFPLERVSRYLRMPERQPDYRAQREHGEFVTNLPLPCEELRRILCDAWHAEPRPDFQPSLTLAAELTRNRYQQESWNWRLR